MREILFKGKKKDNGEWIEGYLMDGGMPGEKRIFIGKLVIGKWTVTADEFDEVDPDTICEYTGLTDKNGKLNEFAGYETIASRHRRKRSHGIWSGPYSCRKSQI